MLFIDDAMRGRRVGSILLTHNICTRQNLKAIEPQRSDNGFRS